MKFNESTAEIEQIGDIQKNNVSIDTANLDFIITILSTNLYSNPIESFIRETVSNAWDSHVEAGVNDPVILELGEDTEENYYCKIQDFGVGLSKERFDKIYRNIGSSTKRNTNNQIGGFGIGRFSALAYSDVVHITSVYDGTRYKYMMYKDGNSISIDLLFEQQTDERNGVEVFVNLKDRNDIYKFEKAIRNQLVYFENLYVEDKTGYTNLTDDFLNFSIKTFNNFKVNTLDSSQKNMDIILGKVRYPLRLDNLSKKYNRGTLCYPISLVFNIGDLEVSPTREEVLYSSKNIKTIEDKLDKAILEIQNLTDKEARKDYKKIPEYIKALRNEYYLTLLEKDNRLVQIRIPKNKVNVTFNGKKYSSLTFIGMYDFFQTRTIIKSNYYFDGSKISYVNNNLSLIDIKNKIDRIYLSDLSLVKNITKSYIRDEFSCDSYFIKLEDVAYYYRLIKNEYKIATKRYYNPPNFDFDFQIAKILFRYFSKNILKLKKFSDKSVPQNWIDKRKADMKAARDARKENGIDWKQNINLYTLRKSNRGYMSISSDSKTFKLNELKSKFKKLTVYGEKGHKKLKSLYILVSKHVNIVEVAPTKLKLLKDVENYTNIDDIMDVNYKLIRNIGTVMYIREKLPFLNKIYSIENLDEISTKIYNITKDIVYFQRRYSSAFSGRDKDASKLEQEIYELCKENNYFNEEIKGLVDENFDLLNKAQCLFLFCEDSYGRKRIPDYRVNIVIDYVLARKLFRPNLEVVFKLKKETVLNIKQEINENN